MVNWNNVKLVYGENTLDHIAPHKVRAYPKYIMFLKDILSLPESMFVEIYIEKRQDMTNMRKYTAKDEEELIKQIESDSGLDSELEQQEIVKGHMVEIRYSGKADGKSTLVRKKPATIHV